MDQQKEDLVPKASEQYEPPSSKVTGVEAATPSGVGVTAPAVKVGSTPAAGSLGTGGPGAGVSERDASAGGLFGPGDPVKAKNRKKKKSKGSKGGTGGGVLVTKGAGPPAPSKRNHSDGSTPRELKRGKLEPDDRGYSRALADPNKLAIVAAEYPVVRLSEEQAKLVEAALEAALDGVSGNNYVPRFVDCWISRGALVCHCGGPQDGAWLREAVSRLEPWDGAKCMVMEASRLPKMEKMTVFCPGSRDPKVVLERLARQNETLNVSSWKLTSSKEVKTSKGEVETALQVMVESTEFKALEALEYPWRPFCGLKRAHCLSWIQGNGDEVDQERMELETGKEVVDPSAQTVET